MRTLEWQPLNWWEGDVEFPSLPERKGRDEQCNKWGKQREVFRCDRERGREDPVACGRRGSRVGGRDAQRASGGRGGRALPGEALRAIARGGDGDRPGSPTFFAAGQLLRELARGPDAAGGSRIWRAWLAEKRCAWPWYPARRQQDETTSARSPLERVRADVCCVANMPCRSFTASRRPQLHARSPKPARYPI